jgi:prevent-host-death family protein
MIWIGGKKMPIIKPISDLRNKSNEISDIAHDSNEPIFITRNGEGDMVVMSMAKYSQLELKIDLMSKLATAQANYAAGDRGRSITDVMEGLRARVHESK